MSAVESAFAVASGLVDAFILQDMLVCADVDLADQLQIIVQDFVKIPALCLAFGKIIGRCRLTTPMLKRPTNTGTSFSSAGSIPPLSYQGKGKRGIPWGL